jgi:uncharacterized protein
MGPPGPARDVASVPASGVNADVRTGYLFLALTLGWAWLWWWPAAALGRPSTDPPTMALLIAGGVGPALAALFLLWRRARPGEWRDYLIRIVDPRRIGAPWWLVVLFLPAVVGLLSLGGYWLSHGGLPVLDKPGELLSQPLSLLGLAVFLFFFGPLPEELGWRGYALDRLQTRHRALTASLLIGVVWWAWHLPLFWIEGSYHADMSLAQAAAFSVVVPAHSVILTWIYNATRRSTLAAILYHYTVNLTGQFIGAPAEAELFEAAILVIVAAVIGARWSGKAGQSHPAVHAP